MDTRRLGYLVIVLIAICATSTLLIVLTMAKVFGTDDVESSERVEYENRANKTMDDLNSKMMSLTAKLQLIEQDLLEQTSNIGLYNKFHIIFNDQRKAIQMRMFARRLIIISSKVQTTKYYDSSGSKQWKFSPIEDTAYFMILHEERNLTIGIVDSSTKPPSDRYKRMECNYRYLTRNDERYHWQIRLQTSGYYRFINRATGLALDAADNSQVYPHTLNNGTYQDWKIM